MIRHESGFDFWQLHYKIGALSVNKFEHQKEKPRLWKWILFDRLLKSELVVFNGVLIRSHFIPNPVMQKHEHNDHAVG